MIVVLSQEHVQAFNVCRPEPVETQLSEIRHEKASNVSFVKGIGRYPVRTLPRQLVLQELPNRRGGAQPLSLGGPTLWSAVARVHGFLPHEVSSPNAGGARRDKFGSGTSGGLGRAASDARMSA